MLKFEGFQLIDNGIAPFKFQQLVPISSSLANELMYGDDKGNQFVMAQYDFIEDVKLIDSLAKIGAILNYKGSLKKQNKIFIFYTVGQFMNIGTYAQTLLIKNQRVDQRFCIEFFQSFSYLFSEIQMLGQYIKLLSPSSIGLRNPNNEKKVGFGLLLPFSCKFFNCILKQQYVQNIKFVAPQIIRHFNFNSTEQVCQKQFRKSCLYSIGLIILLCFGYNFTVKQRIQSSKNDKQFRNIFKKIRKQIKLLHNGKFVPKVLKLVLQDCQKSRQTLQTFMIKIQSPQFQSLKVCKDVSKNDYKFFSTIGESDKSQIQKSQKTINIQINSNCSPLTLTPNSTLNQSYKHKNEFVLNSPINILVSYEDQTPQTIKRSQMIKQIIQEQSQMQINRRKQQMIEQQIKIEQNIQQKNQQVMMQHQNQVIQYNANVLNIGKDNQQSQNIVKFREEEQGEGQFRQQQTQYIDEKSRLRRKLQVQSKVIMATILASFFLYGAIGYFLQN